MKIREKAALRNTLLASLVSLLAACGGSDGGGGGASTNNAPTIDESKIVDPVLSENDTDTECKFLEADDRDGVKELRCDFSELTTFKVAGQDEIVSPDGLTISIDLLTGIVDQDTRDAMSIKDVSFVYAGTSCLGLNPITIEEDFPECGTLETIRNILAENLGPEELLEYDLLSDDDALLLYQTRIALSRPRFADKYGFELKRDSVLVTPTELIPVLNANERAEVHLQYTVTDGKDEILRRTRIVVNGDSAPPVYVGPDLTDPSKQQVIITGSDETLLDLDLLRNVLDIDVERIRAIGEANGVNADGLINGYIPQDLRFQFLRVENFVPISGTTGVKGATSGAGYRVGTLGIDPRNRRPFLQLFIDTKYFQSRLEADEFVDIVFEYDIVDSNPSNTNIEGQQFVERLKRTIAVRVRAPRLGVNFADRVLEKRFGIPDPETRTIGLGIAEEFSLTEGATLVNSGAIIVENIVSDDEDTFGVVIDRMANTVTVDSTAFLNTKIGETRTLIFDYVLTDNETNIKYDRTLSVSIDGVDLNYLQGADYGFESGVIIEGDAENEGGNWSIVDLGSTGSLVPEAPPADTPFDAGNFVMKAGAGFASMALQPSLLKLQDFIGPDQGISVNFWAKQADLDSNLLFAFLSDDGQQNRKFEQTDLPQARTTGWEEYTVYLNASADDFNGQADIGFFLEKGLSDEVLFDNVRILPWRNAPRFDYQEDGTFDSGVLGDFVTNQPGNVEASDEAKFTGDGGLLVNTTGQTAPTTVSLPPSAFVQGISSGSRYRFNADFRYPDLIGTAGLVVNVSLVDDAAPDRRLTKTIVVEQSFWVDASATFDIDSLNVDNDDWSNIDVRLELEFPDEDRIYYIDNIRFYQVP